MSSRMLRSEISKKCTDISEVPTASTISARMLSCHHPLNLRGTSVYKYSSVHYYETVNTKSLCIKIVQHFCHFLQAAICISDPSLLFSLESTTQLIQINSSFCGHAKNAVYYANSPAASLYNVPHSPGMFEQALNSFVRRVFVCDNGDLIDQALTTVLHSVQQMCLHFIC